MSDRNLRVPTPYDTDFIFKRPWLVWVSFSLHGWLLCHISSVDLCHIILVPKGLPVGSSYSPVSISLIFHPIHLIEWKNGWAAYQTLLTQLCFNSLLSFSTAALPVKVKMSPYGWRRASVQAAALPCSPLGPSPGTAAGTAVLFSQTNFSWSRLASLTPLQSHFAKEARNRTNLCSYVLLLCFPALGICRQTFVTSLFLHTFIS